MNDQDLDTIVPEYLLELSNVGFTDVEVRDSGSESNERLSGEGSSTGTEEEMSESSSYDGSVTLDDILASTDTISTSVTSLQFQVDNLNENLVTLNDNINLGISLLFTITFLYFLTLVFKVFNKVLGLGSA